MKTRRPEIVDRSKAAFWNGIRIGDFVSLADFQSLADAGASSADCRVLGIRDILVGDSADGRPLARYRLHELEGPKDSTLYFLALSSGEEFELRIYFEPAEFSGGTRDDLIDSEQTWLFLPPPDPEDFISSNLEFAPYPDAPAFAENGVPRKRVWSRTGFGRTLYGSYRFDESYRSDGSYDTGGNEVPVMIAEYAADDADAPNPCLLVLEERWLDRRGDPLPSGGLVSVFLGCRIDPSCADVFPG